MLHIFMHFGVPVLVAFAFYRPAWRPAALLLIATMVVDVDHVLADPIYDPERCSLGFHPLHTAPAIALYMALAVAPLLWRRGRERAERMTWPRAVHVAGVGLLLHMALDWSDCLL